MENRGRETGTTTVGIVCKDCVVIASDSKSTLGWMISSKDVQKIYKIDDKILVTTAGGSGDTQQLVRILRAEIALYRNTRLAPFTMKAAVSLLSNLLQSVRYYPFLAMMLLGGHDDSGFRLYSVDPLGGSEEGKYASTGSGSPFAYGVMENDFRADMSRDEGIRLAVRAINAARERDVMSGGKIVATVVTKDGVEYVPDGKIEEILQTAKARVA